MTRYVSLRIPDDLADALDAEARRLDRTRTWVIVRALRSTLPAGEEGTKYSGSRASSSAGVGERSSAAARASTGGARAAGGERPPALTQSAGGGDEPTLPRA